MVWGCLIVGLILFLIARFSVKGKGKYGEDRIYDILQKVDGYKATLPNCYLPKGNGETAEVDLIFLHESGIYVFESKNYSGWIFGSENQKYWTRPALHIRLRVKRVRIKICSNFFNKLYCQLICSTCVFESRIVVGSCCLQNMCIIP